MNFLLVLHGWFWLIEVLEVKYLNNMIEQDPPLHHEADPASDRLQILSVCISDTGWHRSGPYDPQAAISNQWPIRISTIRDTRRITVSSDSRFCNRSENCHKAPRSTSLQCRL